MINKLRKLKRFAIMARWIANNPDLACQVFEDYLEQQHLSKTIKEYIKTAVYKIN